MPGRVSRAKPSKLCQVGRAAPNPASCV